MIETDMDYYNNQRDWKYKDNDTATRIKNYNELLTLVETLQNEKASWMQHKELKNLYKA
jgi:hypothetical protein